MRCGIVVVCVTACAASLVATDGHARLASTPQAPAASQDPPARLILELRVFDGSEEVTTQTRVTVHHAGARDEPLAQATSPDGRVQYQVPSGIYDVQAIHERDGRVVNIRWANRLVVMPYPDEAGRHLEVVNFKPGYGALQIRAKDGGAADASIYVTARREKPAAAAFTSTAYSLFIVPAGTYDLQVRKGAQTSWHARIDVPVDRTRLWIVPDGPE